MLCHGGRSQPGGFTASAPPAGEHEWRQGKGEVHAWCCWWCAWEDLYGGLAVLMVLQQLGKGEEGVCAMDVGGGRVRGEH